MNKKKLCWLFYCLLIVGCSKSEKTDAVTTYEDIINKASLEFEGKEYLKSLTTFETAFNIKPYQEKAHYFLAAAAAFHIRDDEKATSIIISAIKNMNVYENNIYIFDEFQPFLDNDFFHDIKYTYPSLIEDIEFVSKYPEIDKEVDFLFEEDLRVRKNNVSIKEFREVDSININRIIEITKEYEWHPKMWLILWHHRSTFDEDNYIWNYFRPYINQQINNGTIKKSFWARYIDNKSMHEKGEQIYGLYYGQTDKWPIESIENLDLRRSEMSLPPLWFMYLKYRKRLPKEYKDTQLNSRYKNKLEKIKL